MKETWHRRPNNVWPHLHKISRISVQISNPLVISRAREGRDWGGGGKWEWLLISMLFILGRWTFLNINCGDGCTTLNTLKTVELYTLNGWTIWHIHYISIKNKWSSRSQHNLLPKIKNKICRITSPQSPHPRMGAVSWQGWGAVPSARWPKGCSSLGSLLEQSTGVRTGQKQTESPEVGANLPPDIYHF